MTLSLRPYQLASIDAVFDYWTDGGGNPLVVLPTGAGKSLVLASLAQRLIDQWSGMRIGVITHVKELIAQNAQELLRMWPGAPAGIFSAGLGRRDTRAQILFMGIQSVHKKARQLGGFDLLIVDEAHLIPRNADTMYGRFIADCLEIVPDMRVVGLTATPYRLDSGRLDRGSDRIFERVVYDANVRDLIEQGYLSNLISKATAARIDTSKVHVRGGEFVAGELEAAAMAPEVVQSAVAEIVAMGRDRAGWLAFCTGVDHAKQVRDLMRSHNISCEMVTGDTPAGERDRIINAYKAKQIRCLTSVAVLTTGFNAPHVDLIAMIRPTLSTGLFVQMIGRGLRLAPGKKDCLVLDFAGNSVRHGPVDAVKPQKSGDAGDFYGEEKIKPDTVRAKECPHCQELVGLATIECPSCGHEWPREAPRHEAQALDDAPILSTEKVAEKWLGVDDMRFTIHRKPGSPDSVRIDYLCGVTTHKEWLCFEHSGYPQRKAVELWRRMGGGLPVPKTTDEAMSRKDELSFVTAISVKRNPGTKYFTITDRQVYAADAAE